MEAYLPPTPVGKYGEPSIPIWRKVLPKVEYPSLITVVYGYFKGRIYGAYSPWAFSLEYCRHCAQSLRLILIDLGRLVHHSKDYDGASLDIPSTFERFGHFAGFLNRICR